MLAFASKERNGNAFGFERRTQKGAEAIAAVKTLRMSGTANALRVYTELDQKIGCHGQDIPVSVTRVEALLNRGCSASKRAGLYAHGRSPPEVTVRVIDASTRERTEWSVDERRAGIEGH